TSVVDSDSDEEPISQIARKFTFRSLELPTPPDISLSSPVSARTIKHKPEPARPFQSAPSSSSSTVTHALPLMSAIPETTPAAPNYSGRTLEVENILQEIKELKNMCCRNFASIKLHQANLITAVENLSIRMNSEVSRREVSQAIKFGFPFTEVKKLMEFEEKIKLDLQYRDNAKAQLSRTGGGDVTEVTNNVFRKLMSDEVSNKFTLYGTSEKGVFSKLDTYELIIDTVRAVRSTTDATETEVKKAVGSWLLHASDRIKSLKKSQAKKLAQTGQ
ncbi:unnamed protein product, partial [Allacma fusca]